MSGKTNSKSAWALALAAVAILPSLSFAQYQTQDSAGRLLDANNRLGSGGVNDERQTRGTDLTADDIVYGNVTKGKEFRGNLGTTDARAFRGNISRPSDTLTREAGGSVYQQDTGDRLASQRYYGDRRGVTEPGFQHLQPGSPGTFSVQLPTYRLPGDLRLDASIPNEDLGISRPSQYIVPRTSLDPIEAMAYRDMARGLQPRRDLDNAPLLSSELMSRLRLSEQRVRDMRDEVLRTSGESPQPGRDEVTLAPETPINDPMSQRIDGALQNGAINSGIDTQQAIRQKLLSASRQSSQYAELQKRLDRFRRRQAMTDEEANREFMAEWQAAQEAKKATDASATPPEIKPQPLTPSQATPQEKKPSEETAPDVATDRRTRFTARMKEMEESGGPQFMGPSGELTLLISSFADGVKALGLKGLLADAEKSMQAGRFTQALDYYDAALAVAPDNSMVMMGRAVGELGAGFYTRAQVHLEQVLSADPAMLMARYDLRTFYGDDRLQYIVRDLKDLAQTETRQSRPLFLLSFIAFSTENRERALDYLNLAQQRGGSAEFYAELKEYWGLDKSKKQPKGPTTLPVAPAAAPNK